MSYYIDCFKSYEFKIEDNYKNECQIVLKGKAPGEYIHPSTLSKIDDYLEKYNLRILYNLIPHISAEDLFGEISIDNAKKIFKNFKSQDDCLKYFEENKILEKIINEKPDEYENMLLSLKKLIEKWNEGYYVYQWY